MSASPRDPFGRSGLRTASVAPLRAALEFALGRGFVTLRDPPTPRGIAVEHVRMEISGLRFPFDVRAGVERFRSDLCTLGAARFSIGSDLLDTVLRVSAPSLSGFFDVALSAVPAGLRVAARTSIFGSDGHFSATLVPVPGPHGSLRLAPIDAFGVGALRLPVPALLHELLLRLASAITDRLLLPALAPAVEAATVELEPLRILLAELLVPAGWKLPDFPEDLRIAVRHEGAGFSLEAALGGQFSTTGEMELAGSAALAASEALRAVPEAESALFRGDLRRAGDLLRDAAQAGGAHPTIEVRLADVQLALGSAAALDEARAWARQRLHSDPHDIDALACLARELAGQSRQPLPDDVLLPLVAALESAGRRADAALTLLSEGSRVQDADPARAAAALAKASSIDPASPAIARAEASLAHARGDAETEEGALRRLAALATDPAVAHGALIGAARILLQRKSDPAAASVLLQRAQELEPNSPELHEAHGDACAASGRFADAVRSWSAAVAIFASSHRSRAAALQLRIARAWEEGLHDPASALAASRRAIDLEPQSAAAWDRTLRLVAELGRTDEALRMVAQAVALFETTWARSQAPDARSALLRALRMAAAMDESRGRPDAAAQHWRRLIELAPDDDESFGNLERYLQSIGRIAELDSLYARRLTLPLSGPERARTLVSLSRVAAVSPDGAERARRLFREAKELDPLLDDAPAEEDGYDAPERPASAMVPPGQAAPSPPAPTRIASLEPGQSPLEQPRTAPTPPAQPPPSPRGTPPSSPRPSDLPDTAAQSHAADAAAAALVALRASAARARPDSPEARARSLEALAAAEPDPLSRARALSQLGQILYHDLERPAEARDALDEARTLDPELAASDPGLLSTLEAIFSEAGEADRLVAVYAEKIAATADSELRDTYRLLVAETVWEQLHDAPRALVEVDLVVASQPRHVGARRRRAELLEAMGHYPDAVVEIRELLALPEVDEYERVDLLRLLGEIEWHRLGDLDSAATRFAALARSVPGDTNALAAWKATRVEAHDAAGLVDIARFELGLLLGRPGHMPEVAEAALLGPAGVAPALAGAAAHVLCEMATAAADTLALRPLAPRIADAAARLAPSEPFVVETRLLAARSVRDLPAIADALLELSELLDRDDDRRAAVADAAEAFDAAGQKDRAATLRAAHGIPRPESLSGTEAPPGDPAQSPAPPDPGSTGIRAAVLLPEPSAPRSEAAPAASHPSAPAVPELPPGDAAVSAPPSVASDTDRLRAIDDRLEEGANRDALALLDAWLPGVSRTALRRSLLLRRGRALIAAGAPVRDALLALKGALILDEAAADTRWELFRAHIAAGDAVRAGEQFREWTSRIETDAPIDIESAVTALRAWARLPGAPAIERVRAQLAELLPLVARELS